MTSLHHGPSREDSIRTELSSRSFFRVAGDQQIQTKVREQLHSWLHDKKWTEAELTTDGPVDLAQGVIGSLVLLDDRDGSHTERYRFFQRDNPRRPNHTFVTEVTLHVARSGDAWVWVDVSSPTDVEAAVPKLVRQILEVTDARDGRARLTAEPERAYVDDVDSLIEYLRDPERRGPVFLAGASDLTDARGADIPLTKWRDYVAKILAGTRGIASAYVLDAEATAALNAQLPESHRLTPWTLRTYAPHADFDDPQDGVRHRFLTTRRIVDSHPRALRDTFSRTSLTQSRTIPLPTDVVRLDRRLRAELDRAIIDQLREDPPTAPTTLASPEKPKPQLISEPTVAIAEAPQASQRTRPVWMPLLEGIVRTVVGATSITGDAVTALGELAQRGKSRAVAAERIETRLGYLQEQSDSFEARAEEAEKQRDDALLDLALLQNEQDALSSELQHARRQLAQSGRSDIEWTSPPVEDPPNTFDDVLDLIAGSDHVVFTGNRTTVADLERHASLNTWAQITANAVRVLDDYASHVIRGKFAGSVEEFLRDPPPDAHRFSPSRHAGNETSTTQNTPKYAKPRTLPVPTTVDSAGRTFMGAHFKIAQFARVSPRMHYFNDVSGSGKIYIGYIGRHLPSPLTN